MTSTLRTTEDVCNLALKRIGFRGRVDNLLDGSRVSDVIIRVYGQERDSLIAAGAPPTSAEWDFCERTVPGILLKQAPGDYLTTPWTNAYPSLPWQFEYAYPADALKIRTVKRQIISLPNFDPRYNRYSIDNDNGPQTVMGYSPPQKVILCDVPDAIILYAAQVTDPNQWTTAFLEAFADRLGRVLAPVLKDLNAAKLAAAEEGVDTMQAVETRG